MLWVRTLFIEWCTRYFITFVSDLRQGGGFFPGSQVSSIDKTDCHDIIEILLKVAFNTITHRVVSSEGGVIKEVSYNTRGEM